MINRAVKVPGEHGGGIHYQADKGLNFMNRSYFGRVSPARTRYPQCLIDLAALILEALCTLAINSLVPLPIDSKRLDARRRNVLQAHCHIWDVIGNPRL